MTSLRQRTILPLRGTSGALWFTLVARLCGLHSAAAAAAKKKKKKGCWICAQHEAKHMSRCYRVNVRFTFVDFYSLMYGQMKSSEG